MTRDEQAARELNPDPASNDGHKGPGIAATRPGTSYATYFRRLAIFDAHAWQDEIGNIATCKDRLLRIPTGFGKTLGVLGAWLYHRVELADDTWPRRLVWCLPMRVLVEQTESEVRAALQRVGRLWDERSSHDGKVGVQVLLGGADSGEWHLEPEHCSVLIGTQDMLLSRALNRGYGAHRARWPLDFGLLNLDCLWVMDEVQLMDVGLATSGQLHAFRATRENAGHMPRPCRSWWMSATLQRAWLQKSPETQGLAAELAQSAVPAKDRTGHLWEDVEKPLRQQIVKDVAAIAKLTAQMHLETGTQRKGPTLVIVNTVEAAVEIRKILQKDKRLAEVDIRLVHSRFRPHERAGWRETFLNRRACAAGIDRIIVATQVIEAGVDISAAVLITELAPWPSLVQRFGRAARWGGSAEVIVVDRQPQDDRAAAPYTRDALNAARDALGHIQDGSPRSLETLEETRPELLPSLYPYAPKHLILSHELDDLFDTTPDLSGADIDISRFIRSGEERDLQVFWQGIAKDEQPTRRLRAAREALCSVPFLKARDWLCGKESSSSKAPHLKQGMRAWIWDWLDGEWRRVERKDLYPGQTVLVDANNGGYDVHFGWTPDSTEPVQPVAPAVPTEEELADAAEDDEHLSAYPWQTIAVHGAQVGDEAATLAGKLCPALQSLFHLAGRWHDAGKAHEVFQSSIKHKGRPARRDLAKAPDGAWLPLRQLYPEKGGGRRAGFRHELASTLGLFAVLIRHAPDHPALLGRWRILLDAAGTARSPRSRPTVEPNQIEREVLALSADDFDLLAYLVCSHHGKVRTAWHSSPADQQAMDDVVRIRGVREGDVLPSVLLADESGQYVRLPESTLTLSAAGIGLSPVTGRGWTDRVLGLMARHGSFQLAYLEALLRVADIRASRRQVRDLLLEEETVP
jgi:CRISPR-associated endonuclease/helicase Cas3